MGGAREETLLLFLGADVDRHGPGHREFEWVALGRRRGLDFLDEDRALHRRPARPAIWLGPAISRPALLVQDALPADDVGFGDGMAEPQPVADILGQAIADKAAHLIAKRQLVVAEAKIHRGRSSVRRL